MADTDRDRKMAASCAAKSVRRRVQSSSNACRVNPTINEMVLEAIGRNKDPTGMIFTALRHATVVYAVVVCVCLSQVGVLLKQLNVGSRKQRHTIAQGTLVF